VESLVTTYGRAMSVVGSQTRRRWGGVAVLIAALVAGPALLAAARTSLATPVPDAGPAQLLARALAQADAPHQGVVESQATLGLPDLTGLGDVAGLLGGTTRSRVWWSGPSAWRVDSLTNSGETDDYGTSIGLVSWDYEANRLTTVIGADGLRLPRTVDLLPPQIARRFLDHLSPQDTISRLPDRLVAGAPAAGLRVRPGDSRSSLSAVELWVRRDGLPVEVRILDRTGLPALTTRYLQLETEPPSADLLVPPDPADAKRTTTEFPDVAAQIAQRVRRPLPASLVGLPSSEPLAPVATTYGRGLVRFVVLPLSAKLVGEVIDNALDGGATSVEGLQGGDAVQLGTSVLNAVAVRRSGGSGRGYVIAGLVTPDLLRQAAQELLDLRFGPPPPSPSGAST
jgi:hypothetical protein